MDINHIILGLIQGLAEWLPVSSEGLLVLSSDKILPNPLNINEIIRLALVLHLGTFCAALIYFKDAALNLIKTAFQYNQSSQKNQKLLQFILISTAISGSLGIILLKILDRLVHQLQNWGHGASLLIDMCLIITGILELKAKHAGYRQNKDLRLSDSIWLGIAQGFACFPGLSRSGTTVSTLLFLKFDRDTSLFLSFLMSLPIVFIGNIVMNFNDLSFITQTWPGIIAAFISGFLTIHLLLSFAKRVNFGTFMLIFGCLTIAFSLFS